MSHRGDCIKGSQCQEVLEPLLLSLGWRWGKGERRMKKPKEDQVTPSSPYQCLPPILSQSLPGTICYYPHLPLEGNALDQTFKILPNDVIICGFSTVMET